MTTRSYDRCPSVLCHVQRECVQQRIRMPCHFDAPLAQLSAIPPVHELDVARDEHLRLNDELATEADLAAFAQLGWLYRFGTYLALRVWEAMEMDWPGCAMACGAVLYASLVWLVVIEIAFTWHARF